MACRDAICACCETAATGLTVGQVAVTTTGNGAAGNCYQRRADLCAVFPGLAQVAQASTIRLFGRNAAGACVSVAGLDPSVAGGVPLLDLTGIPLVALDNVARGARTPAGAIYPAIAGRNAIGLRFADGTGAPAFNVATGEWDIPTPHPAATWTFPCAINTGTPVWIGADNRMHGPPAHTTLFAARVSNGPTAVALGVGAFATGLGILQTILNNTCRTLVVTAIDGQGFTSNGAAGSTDSSYDLSVTTGLSYAGLFQGGRLNPTNYRGSVGLGTYSIRNFDVASFAPGATATRQIDGRVTNNAGAAQNYTVSNSQQMTGTTV